MGNSTSHYERHEDVEQQQRMIIGKEFRLILGQLDLSSELIKRKNILLNIKQQRHRNLSSSSSSSSSDQQSSSVSLIQLDIPTSPFDSNEVNTHSLIQYLLQQDSYGKGLAHIFKLSYPKSQVKTLPTVKIAAIYYDQTYTTPDLNIELISLLNENKLEEKLEEFNEKNILSIYPTKSTAYIIYTKDFSMNHKYKLIRSTTMSKTAVENFEWLHPFINYSNLGYRLCGIIPILNSSVENSFTVYWLFEQIDKIQYDYCIIEYKLKTFSLSNWISLLNLMLKQEWKLVTTFDYNQKKKTNEHIYILLFFQRLKNSRD